MKKIEVINQSDEKYPSQLLQIMNPPKKLYVEGESKLLKQEMIAIVGSRNATEYGKKYAGIFAKQLAQEKITIISGMAVRNR